MIDASSIASVVAAMPLERGMLVELLRGLPPETWAAPTECPEYSIKGIALHLLGDDLSLLSRQRDREPSGLIAVAAALPGADFRTVLDAFNDRWVAAGAFLSVEVLTQLLDLTGQWTAEYYAAADPDAPGEPVGLFGPIGASSPMWHAIGREFLERWTHQSQIRRAAGLGSLADPAILAVGLGVVCAIARAEGGGAPDGDWFVGPVNLGPAAQAADILTRAHPSAQVRALAAGPPDAVERLAAACGRPGPGAAVS